MTPNPASPQPRNQRRKDDRPDEITAAALAVFSKKGFAAARVDEVAQQAGVSKGLLYLYFKTKEEILKAVIKRYIVPKVDELTALVSRNELTTEAFLRGPFLTFAQHIPHTPAIHLVRIILTEGQRHPKLIDFYWKNVVSRGIAALQLLLRQGAAKGEYPASNLEQFPQLLIAPVLLSVIWHSVFAKQSPLDSDAMIAVHIDMIINQLKYSDTSL